MSASDSRLARSIIHCCSLALLLASGTVLLPAQALAQDRPSPQTSSQTGSRQQDDSRFSVRGSLGMTASPETFNMTLEMPWKADELVSVGPLFQLGFSDDNVLFAGTLQAYLTPRLEDSLRDWHPYGHMGMGFIYLEDDDRVPGRDEEDAAFLFTVGTGVEYALSDSFYMGTGFLFDIIPTGAVGDRFVWGWQVLTFRHEF
jgi:hypothetical protein